MGVCNKNYFGEAIPFSRADMMSSYNFDGVCDCDLEKNVTKAKIWKMPAAQKFINDNCGGDVALAFWKKSMRDAVSPKPNIWSCELLGNELPSIQEYVLPVLFAR